MRGAGTAGEVEGGAPGRGLSRERLVALVQEHAGSLLSTARRHSLCADDAQDAYQRTLEILLRRAATLEEATVGGWLHTVVRHEALAVRESRQRQLGANALDADAHVAEHLPGPHERVEAFERLTSTAEALARLKPQEARALGLQAQGHSYREICRITGWSYTKVNRSIAEGRRAFLDRHAGIEAGRECRRWEALLGAIADGEAGAGDLAQIRPHLRRCRACRASLRAQRLARGRLAILLPGPLLAGAAGGPDPPGARILSRLGEAIFDLLGGRMPSAGPRSGVALDLGASGKVAAVAASVTALAGGGLAAVRADLGPPRHASSPAHRVRVQRSARPASGAAAVPLAPARPLGQPLSPRAGAAPPGVVRRRGRASSPSSRAGSGARSVRAAEFEPLGSPAPAAPAAEPGVPVATARLASSSSTSTRPAPMSTTTRAAPTGGSTGSAAGRSAPAEFEP